MAPRPRPARAPRDAYDKPLCVGHALATIAQDPEVLETTFQMLETQRLLESEGKITGAPTE